MPALASRALVEVLRGVLGGDHADLEHQVVAAGPDSGDRPPLEEGPDADAVDHGDFTLDDLSSDFLRVGSQVIVGWEGYLARAAEVNDEVAGGAVDGVVLDGGREETDWEAVVGELGVSRRWA